MFGKPDPLSREKTRRVSLHEATIENDISYLGPFTYQHFKLFGWFCIVLSQIAVILHLCIRFVDDFPPEFIKWERILNGAANLSLPFLLISNFSQILNSNAGYRKQLVKNSAAAAGVCALYYLLFYRYFVGMVSVTAHTGSNLDEAEKLLYSFLNGKIFSFNIFVDLFICTLAMLFLNYRPRRLFRGKSMLFFRLLTLIPVAYEVSCMVLKSYAAAGKIQIPVAAFPFLTVKPPMTFVLFVFLALFLKIREIQFYRHGRPHEEYQEFLKTNRNSWHYSVFLAAMLVIISGIDYVLGKCFPSETVIGFGASTNLVFLAPVVLLFSYTRKPRFQVLDYFIPPTGMGMILWIYLEGFHWLLIHLVPH